MSEKEKIEQLKWRLEHLEKLLANKNETIQFLSEQLKHARGY